MAVVGLVALSVVGFGGQPSASAVVGSAPASGMVADPSGIASAARSTVKIQAPGCGRTNLGSGFAISAGQVVTNAHVVAGAQSVTIITADRGYANATVVVFDPGRDIAVLNVSGLPLRALPMADANPGDAVAAIGYPGGGPETVALGTVGRLGQIAVPDIYGHEPGQRQVWVTLANLKPGNSGGPLVNSRGAVLGIIFAASTSESGVTYALTNHEIATDLAAAQARSQAVSDGPCF
jgi:S1-C subfamily serine protease